jgi:phosphohistidine phosphatase
MTSRQLLLIRHAKAERHGEVDIERRLAKRGRADAAAIGRWLTEHGLIPDRIVVSPATRARETWQLAADAAGVTAKPVVDERIYRNTVDDLLQAVAQTPRGVRTLAIVGHNPSMEDLAVALDDGTGDAAARTELTSNYPTGGVAVFAVGADWSGLGAGSGTLTGFGVPRG